MATVVVAGWLPGFDKVACTKLLRTHLGLGLAEGKGVTDGILKKCAKQFELPDEEQANRPVLELTEIGALAYLAPGEGDTTQALKVAAYFLGREIHDRQWDHIPRIHTDPAPNCIELIDELRRRRPGHTAEQYQRALSDGLFESLW